jgi:predicted nuclease of restriction endonuclease-like (RecB) superfamily
LLILNKVTPDDERMFYLRGIADFGWTRSVLLNQIKAAAFERSLKERKTHNFQKPEERLIERLRDFILELGYGFCFIGRQYRLSLGAKDYFVDLLFYHRLLRALVALELKVGPFEPAYAGQMDLYLNLLNKLEKAEDDMPSIGVILCAEKDNLEVEFSLKSKTDPIGVAECAERAGRTVPNGPASAESCALIPS